jgi:hypothetical protein
MAFIKFELNKPVVAIFNFDQPKEYTGQFGLKYNYGVEAYGDGMTISATKYLHDRLQALSPLTGKTIEITKIMTENQRQGWNVKEYDTESSSDAPQSPVSGFKPQSQQSPISERMDSLEARIKVLETWKEKQPVWAEVDGKQEQVPF